MGRMCFFEVKFESIQKTNVLQKNLKLCIAKFEANSNNIYIAFTNIRTKIAEDFDDRAEGLGELLEVEVPRSMPSLVNSWRLYQDPLRAEELVERNRVEHPSWMPHRYAALSR